MCWQEASESEKALHEARACLYDATRCVVSLGEGWALPSTRCLSYAGELYLSRNNCVRIYSSDPMLVKTNPAVAVMYGGRFSVPSSV
jgi:hypothetical protein